MEKAIRKIRIPKRKFTQEPKKMISWRLNSDLIQALEEEAKALGWNTTDLVSLILDLYLQNRESEKNG